jgi:hypothetical protein
VSVPPNRPRPRRPLRSGGTASAERQSILIRRGVAAGAGLLILVLLILGIDSCLDSRKDRAFRDYAADARSLVQESDGLSKKLFTVLSRPSQADSLDVQNEINAQSTDAEQLVERARDTDHPGELNNGHNWFVEALEFRRDALDRIAQRIPAALADRGRQPAIRSIAGQMQVLIASDVIYLQRALPELQLEFEDRGIDEVLPATRFLPDLGWLNPETVETRLSRIGGVGRPATPGLHGTGLQSVTAKPSGTALTEGTANRIAATDQLTFEVQVQNQGESEETDVGVSVELRNGRARTVDQTISRIAAGATQAVSIPITGVTTGTVTNVTVKVAPVPGERVRDNNEATYQVVFTGG